MLTRDGEMLTRILRWDPGFEVDRTARAVHDTSRRSYILSGAMHDTTLDRIFAAGDYACRPPGMVHGPWTSAEGCQMFFEVRYLG